jgi:hypothetical protein
MDILSTLLNQQTRSISLIQSEGGQTGLLLPSVVISESHLDTLEITDHPIEAPTTEGYGSVADHAWRKPGSVTMKVGFGSSGSLLDLWDTTGVVSMPWQSPKQVYETLQGFQRARSLLEVNTGKRLYKNMLLKSLTVTTDKDTENVLSADLIFQEVLISRAIKTIVEDKSRMRDRQSTAAQRDTGNKSAVPTGNNALVSQIGSTRTERGFS